MITGDVILLSTVRGAFFLRIDQLPRKVVVTVIIVIVVITVRPLYGVELSDAHCGFQAIF